MTRAKNKVLELDLEIDIRWIKRFVAELFQIEMNKMLSNLPEDLQKDNKVEDIHIICNGNGGRNYNREVISVKKKSHLVGASYKSLQSIRLSRNGIYNSLPEALFHPLTLGDSYSTVDDIVESIQKNQKDTLECQKFFSLFDNIFFNYKTSILERQLEWPYNNEPFIKELIQQFLGHDLEHDEKQSLTLLSSIAFHEEIKGNYEKQAFLLSLLLGEKVEIQERKHLFGDVPYQKLGSSLLGIDSGLSGPCYAELNDIQIDIWLDNANDVDESIINEAQENYIRGMMDLFSLSARKIHIRYQIMKKDIGVVLGEDGYLGINTVLS